MFDWNDLRHFLAVAEAGSSAGAAKMLGTSQPTVVRRIAALEERLRLKLFDRHANGYRLTTHGEALCEQARCVKKEIKGFEAQARARARTGESVIRLTVPEASVSVLTSLIVDFRKRFPDIRVEMRSEDSWLDIAKGEADVAVRAGDYEQSDLLVGTKFTNVGWALYASPDYVDARGRPQDPSDLSKHAIIGAEGRLADAKAFRWLEAHAGSAAIVWRGNVVSAVLSAVRAGLGIAPMPCAVAAREPGVEAVSEPIPELTGNMWVLTRRELRLDPAIKHLMELISAHLRSQSDLISGQNIVLR